MLMKTMFDVLEKKELAPRIKMLKISAPEISRKANPGQFVIIRLDKTGERFPLTLADWNANDGTITLVFLEIGVSTMKLGALEVGDKIKDVSGPLGNASEIQQYGSVAVICGGVGSAASFPIARALKEAGNRVVSILGARTENLLVLENKLRQYSDELYVSTDDGSKGTKGYVSDVLKTLIEKGQHFDLAYAIGPPLMMRATVNVAKNYDLKTIVSLDPIMVDGCGMCGACRVTVGGETKFSCLDGPEFDGSIVNFDELIKRLRTHRSQEEQALNRLKSSI
jgi:ferredoxin/flavodoxin---NADP+ reductase